MNSSGLIELYEKLPSYDMRDKQIRKTSLTSPGVYYSKHQNQIEMKLGVETFMLK